MAVLMESHRLEDDGFGFAYDDRFTYDRNRGDYNETWWLKFPVRYKRQYLRRKIQQHPERRCIFGTFVQGVLDLPHDPRTVEEENAFIKKLIDAWLCGKFICVRDVLNYRCYHKYLDWYRDMHRHPPEFITVYWEDFKDTLPIALATSAIRNGDCDELQAVFDRYISNYMQPVASGDRHRTFLERQSTRFGGICPLDVAAKRGSGDIIKVLLKNRCGILYSSLNFTTNALSVAARAGNKEALKVWIDHMKSTNSNLAVELRAAVNSVTKVGKFEMIKFIEQECGFEFDNSELLFDSFIDAILSGQLDLVQKCLDQGGFDINKRTQRRPHGALFAAISTTTKQTLPITTLLLTNGVNPNDVHRRTHLTPVQTAVKMQNLELTKLLIEHGADVHAPIFDPRKKTKMPLLHVAVQNMRTTMVRILLAQGLEREYTWKGKKYEVKGDPTGECNSEVWYEVVKWNCKEIGKEHDGYVVVIGG
jgi:ankyrin repeat protein